MPRSEGAEPFLRLLQDLLPLLGPFRCHVEVVDEKADYFFERDAPARNMELWERRYELGMVDSNVNVRSRATGGRERVPVPGNDCSVFQVWESDRVDVGERAGLVLAGESSVRNDREELARFEEQSGATALLQAEH